MSELSDAVQIVKVAGDGVEILLRVGAGGVRAVKRMAEFLIGMLNFEKSQGRVGMKKLLKKGGEMEVFRFSEKDFAEVKRYLKKYGILYAELPDLNLHDGMKEILFPADEVPRMNLLVEKLKLGQITTLEEYFANADEVEKLLDFFRQYNDPNESRLDPLKNAQAYNDLLAKMRMAAAENDSRLAEIEFNTNAIHKETTDKVYLRTPYQYEYLMLDKAEILFDSDSGQFRVFLDKAAEYELVSMSGETTSVVSGSELSRGSFEFEEKEPPTISKDISFEAIIGEDPSRLKIETSMGKGTYIWVEKENVSFGNESSRLHLSLYPERGYEIYGPEELLLVTLKGSELYYRLDAAPAPGTPNKSGEAENVRNTGNVRKAGTFPAGKDSSGQAAFVRDDSRIDITIDQSLVRYEDDKGYMTRVPGTRGQKYLYVEKTESKWVYSGETTLLTSLEKDKTYDLYDDKNNIVDSMKGSDLFSAHYDKVRDGVRERYGYNKESGNPARERR